jgi:hypothetical protein
MIRIKTTRTVIMTAIAADMTATMAVALAAAAVLPAVVVAARPAAEARDRVADRAAAVTVGPKVVIKRTPSLDNPGKTRKDTFRKRMLARAKPMTLLGGSFHLFERKYFVAIRRAERLILLIRPPNFVYTQ